MRANHEWQDRLAQWQSYLLMAFAFSLPLSSAAPNLILVLILVLWLLEANFARKWQYIQAHPLLWPMLAFAILYPLSLLWSENQAWGWHMVARHSIYCLFPLLLTAARPGDVPKYLSAFVVAMTLSESVSYAVWFHWIEVPGIDPQDPAGFLGHWEYNPFLALAIYLMSYRVLFRQVHGWRIIWYVLFIITMTINMFITGGRIGQVAYFVVMGILLLQYFSQLGKLKQGALSVLFGLPLIFILAYNTSTLFQTRVDKAVDEIRHHDQTQTGSVNTRFIFWQQTLAMIVQRPLLGTGVGDYPQDYNQFVGDRVPDTARMGMWGEGTGHNQPHNQYLFEAANFGLLGVGIFIWLWVSIVRQAYRQQDACQHWRWALIALTLTIMLTDSYLLVQAFSYWFVLMMAVLWQPRVCTS